MNVKICKFLSQLCGVLAKVFVAIAVLIIFAGVVGIFLGEKNFWDGWNKFTGTFSPYNVTNFIMIMLVFSPYFILNKLKTWLEPKKITQLQEPKYFELDGKYASMIPKADGGMRVIVPQGMSIADFMQNGSVVTFDSLPDSMRKSL